MMAAESADEEDKVHAKCKAKYFEDKCPVCGEKTTSKVELSDELSKRIYRPGVDTNLQDSVEVPEEVQEMERKIRKHLEEREQNNQE